MPTNVLQDTTEVRGKKRYHFESSTDESSIPTAKLKVEVNLESKDALIPSKLESAQAQKFRADIENGAPALKYRDIEGITSSEYRLDYFCDEVLYEIFKYLDSSDLLAVRK